LYLVSLANVIPYVSKPAAFTIECIVIINGAKHDNYPTARIWATSRLF